MARRVVITGLGVVAPNGIGKEAFWENLVAGKSAVDYITAFDPSPYPCKVAAEVRDFDPADFVDGRGLKMMGRFAQLAVAAARLAIEDSGLAAANLKSTAICFGTSAQGIGDIGEAAHKHFLTSGWRSVDPSVGLEYSAHAATSHVQAQLNVAGPATTIASACCTGLDAIGWGAEQIRSGRANVALVGAAEAPISELIVSLFAAGGHLTKWAGAPSRASRPYDAHRSGLVPAEGAAAVILEDLEHAMRRDSAMYAEVLGFGSASETGFPRHGSYSAALAQVIRATLKSSQIDVQDIDYICAHGNSIMAEDAAESAGHRLVFGPYAYRIPISSIKSMVGQAFAAGGILQIVAATLALQHEIAPPTINCEFPDPDCDLDYVPNTSRVVRIRHALIHSHSLGGHLPGTHSAVVIGRVAGAAG